jgi:putative ABC transport system ATP-binding protein
MLQVVDLVKHYTVGDQPVRAVDGVTLRIDPGEMVALYGPSGSGKSTLIDMIAGFRRPDSGMVIVDGRDVHTLSNREHAIYLRATVGIVGEPKQLLEHMSARENASMKLWRTHRRNATRVVAPLLVELGLGERMDQPVRKLSMGERQRTMIALALSTEPKLVLADEPTGSLDTVLSREVLELIHSLCHDRGTAVLLATHDPLAVKVADRAFELRDGHLRDYQPETLATAERDESIAG